MIVAALIARRSTTITDFPQALIAAAIAALFFVAQSNSFRTLTLWSYESFYFPAGTLQSFGVLMAVRRAGGPAWWAVLGLGAACGVLISLHLYFAAWVVGTAVALGVAVWVRSNSWRRAAWCALLVCLMSGVGFAVATLPIRQRYPQLLNWVWLNTFQGTYGLSPTEFLPGPYELARTVVRLVRDSPGLFLASAIGIGLLAVRLWQTRRAPGANPAVWAAGLGLGLQLVVLLALNVKHPGLSAAIGRYLPGAAATLPILFAAALDGFDFSPKRIQYFATASAAVIVALFSVGVQSAVARQAAAAEWLRYADANTEEALGHIAQERHVPRESLRTLWTFGTSSVCYALWMGDDAAQRTFHNDIANVCPHDGEFIIWNGTVPTANGNMKLAEYHDWDVIVLTDGFLADLFPQTRPRGVAHPSSIGTWGFGNLLFVTPD